MTKRIIPLLLFFILISADLMAGRTNPIMVVNCGGNRRLTTDKTFTKALDTCTPGSCPTGFVCYGGFCYPLDTSFPSMTCPSGFYSFSVTDSGGNSVEVCVPECDACDCTSPEGEVWSFSSGQCECQDMSPALTAPVSKVIDAKTYPECDSKCYNGAYTYTLEPIICDGTTSSSEVTITISGITPDHCIQIDDLLNCNLTGDADFTYELIKQVDLGVGLCDDDGDGMIEITFTRDPYTETTLDFHEVSDIVIPACPAFSDPCRCDDPQNVVANGLVTYFHDVLEFVGSTNSPVVITSLAGTTGIFTDASGTTPLTAGTVGMTDANGVFRLEVYRSPSPSGVLNLSYTVAGITGMPDPSTTNCLPADVCPVINIPTLSQWGMIILGLLLTIVAVVPMYLRKTQKS